jgi:lipid-A-disaccharide synthase
MCKEGLQSLFPMEEIAIMGMWELLPHIYSIKVLHVCVPHPLLSLCMMHLTLIVLTSILQRKIEDSANAAMLFQPHAVVTIDSKGFSFRLLKQLKCKGVNGSISLDIFIHQQIWNKTFCCLGRSNQKVQSPLHIHYVSPSFWAWKGGESRLSKLHNFVDHMLCILPFEEEICRLNGLPATYVGHPLLDDAIGLNMVRTCVTLGQHQAINAINIKNYLIQ